MMWIALGLILVVFAALGIGVILAVTEILLGALLIGLGYTVVK